jgi:hypothetical protein
VTERLDKLLAWALQQGLPEAIQADFRRRHSSIKCQVEFFELVTERTDALLKWAVEQELPKRVGSDICALSCKVESFTWVTDRLRKLFESVVAQDLPKPIQELLNCIKNKIAALDSNVNDLQSATKESDGSLKLAKEHEALRRLEHVVRQLHSNVEAFKSLTGRSDGMLEPAVDLGWLNDVQEEICDLAFRIDLLNVKTHVDKWIAHREQAYREMLRKKAAKARTARDGSAVAWFSEFLGDFVDDCIAVLEALRILVLRYSLLIADATPGPLHKPLHEPVSAGVPEISKRFSRSRGSCRMAEQR